VKSRRQALLDRLVAWSPVLLLGSLAAMTYWLNTQVRIAVPDFDGSGRHDPDLFAADFKAVNLDQDGRVRQSLTATGARHYPDNDVTVFEAPVIVFTDPGQPRLEVRADHGTVTGDREHVYLEGHVKVVRDASAGEERDGPIIVTSEYLHVIPKEDRIVTDRPVTVTDPRGTVNAIGLELDNKAKTVKFKSHLSGQLEPQNHRQ
jgi:lipopolysaccharide export system protein LptC